MVSVRDITDLQCADCEHCGKQCTCTVDISDDLRVAVGCRLFKEKE